MTWRPLSDQHFKMLETNLQHIKNRRPPLYEQLKSLPQFAHAVRIAIQDNHLSGIRIVKAEKEKILLPTESGKQMIQAQSRGIQDLFQKGSRFVVLSGLGAGHALLNAHPLLDDYSHTAIGVFEPDLYSWAAFFALFKAQDIIAQDRIALFAGPNARTELADSISREYIFLLPMHEIQYFLGALPVNPRIAQYYVNEAKTVADSVQQHVHSFEETITTFTEHMSRPLNSPPKSVWSCTHRESYIHFPIAEAFLAGFAELGWDTHLEPYDSSFTSPFKIVGHLMETCPDFFLFINTLPTALLEDIGLTRDTVEAIQRPRATLLVDDTTLYEDADNPFYLSEQDWVFTIERSYLSWIQQRTRHTAFLPVATMFDKAGTVREEFAAEISYVGSLPAVGSFLYTLPKTCIEILERVENMRNRDYSHSFRSHLQTMEIGQKQRQYITHAARSFCQTTQKGLTHPDSILEYFLYNTATYLKRKRIVESLLPLGLKVFGPDSWKDVLPPQYRDRYGGFVSRDALADCYASAKLSLNIHSHQCPTCLNPRDFDVPMAGGVVIGDWVEDAERGLLEPGKEMLVYQSIDELNETVRQSLADLDLLESIRRQGQERVQNEHRYVHRARQLLAISSKKSS